MKHKNYLEIHAESYHDLGLQLGEQFADELKLALEWCQSESDWSQKVHASQSYLVHTKKHFPHLIEELSGYAQGAGVSLRDLWVLCMEDEFDEDAPEKCTTWVTNQGLLIAHNEDWDDDAAHAVCLLKKTIHDLTIFELFYFNTLGGNSIAINSHGIVHAINSLSHRDYRVGIPRNVIARWMSESSDPEADIHTLQTLPRSAGYHHTLVSTQGQIWSLECSARKQHLTYPASPFVHTNHFLSGLQSLEADDGSFATLQRYEYATRHVQDPMSISQVQTLMTDSSQGTVCSIFNERTIARMIIDLEQQQAHVWMLREKNKGWLTYPLDFLHT